jgi:hypothetical protein
LVGIAIAVIIVVSVPDLPAVIGGLIGGCGVYPLVAKLMGYTKNGRLTPKGIGSGIGYGEVGAVNDTHNPVPPGAPTNMPKPPAIKEVALKGDIDKISTTIDKVVEFVAPYWHDQSNSKGNR